MSGDLVLVGGRARTGVPGRPPVEDLEVAVRDGRIAAIGASVREAAGPRPEVIQVGGGLILPGFQDAHVHPPSSGLERLRCDLNGAEDAETSLRIVAEYARAHPQEPWILGGGWWPAAFPGGTPRRDDLDAIVPDRPVYLPNRDGHGAWVNTRALEAAGIDGRTPDPPDGRIERDLATGEPSGTLHEGAMKLVERVVPLTSTRDWERAILEAQAYLHALGITAWQDAWVGPEHLDAYLALAGRGRLTARVVTALWWERGRGLDQIEDLAERRARSVPVDGVDAGSVKIMVDGVVESFTAHLLEPYLDAHGDPTGNHGIPFFETDALTAAVSRLDREGFQVHVHAIGDAAVRSALDAFEAARRANGPRGNRHHIAHLQVVHPEDVPRFAALDVTANVQALWACHEPQMDELTIPFLGPERAARQYPFASLARSGARLAFGSDWSVSTPNPLLQIEVAVTRVDPRRREGEAFLPEERLAPAAALEAFTRGSAFVNRLDDTAGTIEPGKAADLIVLDRDPFEAGPIGEARPLVTMVGGRIVHG
ncbi:MAG TPA: amidohydrolase [Actinomycetota bacterium]|nr:amidohydrolase [Actinomycetota bacterium]